MKRKKVVLFIHGLGGDSKKTWGKFPELIEKDKELDEKFGIEYYSFPTSLFRFPFQKKSPTIQHLAEGLRTQIEHSLSDYQEIALVCHSLGGLIAKKYLIEEVKSQNNLRISKLFLFAVPNNGANLATIAGHIAFKHRQLKQVCKDSDFIAVMIGWHQIS